MKTGLIYYYKNLVNGKGYVGQTICGLKARDKGHICAADKGTNAIDRALRKYGRGNFTLEVLEKNIPVEVYDKRDPTNLFFVSLLSAREMYHIKEKNTLSPNGYNLTSGGENGFSCSEEMIKKKIGQKRSEETRKNMSESRKQYYIDNPEALKLMSEARKGKKQSEETKRKRSETSKGKPHSEEWNKKVSEANKGRKRKPFTEEARKNMSEGQKGKILSEAHKKNLSENKKIYYAEHPEARKLIGDVHRGRKCKPFTEEHRKNMSEGQKGKILSEAHKKSLSEASKGKPKSEEHRRKNSEGHKGMKYKKRQATT